MAFDDTSTLSKFDLFFHVPLRCFMWLCKQLSHRVQTSHFWARNTRSSQLNGDATDGRLFPTTSEVGGQLTGILILCHPEGWPSFTPRQLWFILRSLYMSSHAGAQSLPRHLVLSMVCSFWGWLKSAGFYKHCQKGL